MTVLRSYPLDKRETEAGCRQGVPSRKEVRGSCSGLRVGQAEELAAQLAPICGLQVLKILLWLLRLAGARWGAQGSLG